jgi:hypothetical protein
MSSPISIHLLQRLFKTVADGEVTLAPGTNASIVLLESPEQIHLHFLVSCFAKDVIAPGCFSAWVHTTGLGDTALSPAVFYAIVNNFSSGTQTYYLFIANHSANSQIVSYSAKLIKGLT